MKKYKNDIIAISILLIITAVSYLYVVRMDFGKAEYVTVKIDGETNDFFELFDDGEYTIQGEYGVNVIEVKDGSVNVKEADCPDKLCVKHKSISEIGESIVCLPNRVIVSIVGEKEN